ncbi:hypothetical protein [Ruegeria jejuensis]|uniref:hypothetical protein n=1 Tax=Ruegeria jejuensis TaxID=3233338 RepID=UPI00355BD1E1
MDGWFAVKHGIRKHPIFKGKPARLGAWVAMLDEAAYCDTEQDVGGVLVSVKRGELCASQAMLEDITGLSRQQLRTLLSALERSGAIQTRPATKSTKSRTIVTFCNYDKYQTPQPSTNQTSTKDQPTKEQINNIPVGTGDETPSKSSGSILWAEAKSVLSAATGKPPNSFGGMISKWISDSSETEAFNAIWAARDKGTGDPVGYVNAILRNKRQSGSGSKQNAGAFGILKEVG